MAESSNPARFIEDWAIGVVESFIAERGTVTNLSAGHQPDFRIDYGDGRVAIGEVTWHEDRHLRSLFSATDKHGHRVPLGEGQGEWYLFVRWRAQVRRLHGELPDVIADLAAAGVSDLLVQPEWPPGELAARLRDLGIDHIRRGEVDGPDVAVCLAAPTGAWVPDDPDVIVDWLDEVVGDPHYADLTGKLRGLQADELHVFVVSGSATGTDVIERLRHIDAVPPSRAPAVPAYVTHVWVGCKPWRAAAGLWTRAEGWSTVATVD